MEITYRIKWTRYIVVLYFSLLIVGYALGSNLSHIFKGDKVGLDAIVSNPGVAFFFSHNIKFFLLAMILPFINIFLLIIQVIMVGLQWGVISTLTLYEQMTILLRHLIFESIALIIAINISIEIFYITWNIRKGKPKYNRKTGFKIGLQVVLVFICTIIAALMEGNAYVHLG